MTIWSSNSTFGFLEEIKTLVWKDICAPMFTAALPTVAKIWKWFTYPLIKKMWDIYIHIYIYIYVCTHTLEYYSDTKIAWNLAICDNIDESRGY